MSDRKPAPHVQAAIAKTSTVQARPAVAPRAVAPHVQAAVQACLKPAATTKRAPLPVPKPPAVQRAVNPVVQKAPAASGGGRGAVIQCYSGQINKKTDKAFYFFDGDRKGTATIEARSTDEKQQGYIRYSYHKKACILEHIETDPDNGTGLGPLLMYMLAEKALGEGYKTMIVALPRYPDYYARFGFKMDKENKTEGSADTKTVMTKTLEYVQRDWMNPKFADVYVKDWLRNKYNHEPVLSEFPRIE